MIRITEEEISTLLATPYTRVRDERRRGKSGLESDCLSGQRDRVAEQSIMRMNH